ncbi:MAG: GTPase Era [Deltaproteobacteria bacterium]|nr:GTPase Era [Deltaproteobacteria bacterium]
MTKFRSGFVALVGRPNVGKSTLLNHILVEKIAIVTDKPQTTRNRIVGIKNFPTGQMVLVDTPGLHTPKGQLNQNLVQISHAAWRDADLALVLLEAGESRLRSGEREILTRARAEGVPFIVALNKIDQLSERDGSSLGRLPMVLELESEFALEKDRLFFISARDGAGVESLVRELLLRLPCHPAYFPDDIQTPMSERFWVQEVIREQIFKLTRDEIPYSVAVEIDYYRDLEARLSIGASIYVEQDSQKGIIIGRGGSMLKKIGVLSRQAIEAFVGIPIFLELHVAVARNWTRDVAQLKRFGYDQE